MGIKLPIGSSTVTYIGDEKYVRNPEWMPNPLVYTNIGNDNTATVLIRIFDGGFNKFAFMCNTTGNYTVDWGDGITETYAGSSTIAREHAYNYSTCPTTITSLGFKTVLIKIVGTATSLQLWRRPSGTNATTTMSNILEVCINMPTLTDNKILFNNNSATEWSTNYSPIFFKIYIDNITSFTYQFNYAQLNSLQSLTQDTVNGTNFLYQFNYAQLNSLQSLTQDTVNGTSFSSQFYSAQFNSLQSLTQNTVNGTTFSNQFYSAQLNSLQSLTQNTVNGTTFSNQFSSAQLNSLQSLTQDTVNGTNFYYQFAGAQLNSLQSLTQNTVNGTNFLYQFYSAQLNSLQSLDLTLPANDITTSHWSNFITSDTVWTSLISVRLRNPNPTTYPNFCTGLRSLYFKATQMQRAALVQLFTDLPNLAAVSATGTLYLTGGTFNADLTADDKLIATAKGWTLSL